jgi:hypothetical protein
MITVTEATELTLPFFFSYIPVLALPQGDIVVLFSAPYKKSPRFFGSSFSCAPSNPLLSSALIPVTPDHFNPSHSLPVQFFQKN